MKRLSAFALWGVIFGAVLAPVMAFGQDLRVLTVDRPPFSFPDGDDRAGFSIDLWQAVAEDLGLNFEFEVAPTFGTMLSEVQNGSADAAVANISITAEREQVLDFSHTIFEAGLQVMTPGDGGSSEMSSILSAITSTDLLLSVGAAFLLLFCAGLLMWVFERRAQSYFDRPLRQAWFPSFWWALNLVVNGGFEERQPRTVFGRIFGVLLVVSSLFIVSVFVAKITAVLTVDAIKGSVASVNDLYGKQVGTISGSTSAAFLDARDLDFAGYGDLTELIAAFEGGDLDAVVFDAPVLAYYVNTTAKGKAQLIGSVFRREAYGIALPTASPLVEPINRSLLKLRENGTYDAIYRTYFGGAN